MTNHVHVLLRPSQGLGNFMRRLLTGYAVTFNLRHHRNGHLFQNRYKSIIREEAPYLLELVRYIHLNPLRAGLVKGMAELNGPNNRIKAATENLSGATRQGHW